MSPGLVWGKAEKGWCDLVCGVSLDDRANGGCVDVVMWQFHVWYGFSSVGSWSYFREWV